MSAQSYEQRELDDLRRRVLRTAKLHPRVQNPKHGCCVKPKLCSGHLDECNGMDHSLSRPTWPCPTLRALGILDERDITTLERALAAPVQ